MGCREYGWGPLQTYVINQNFLLGVKIIDKDVKLLQTYKVKKDRIVLGFQITDKLVKIVGRWDDIGDFVFDDFYSKPVKANALKEINGGQGREAINKILKSLANQEIKCKNLTKKLETTKEKLENLVSQP